MRKGLTQALIAVAVVTLAMRALAMAPVIGNIPDIVVGDKEDTTPGNTFVFPDAINLSNYVTDTDSQTPPQPVDPATVKWSYEFVGQTAKYRINNVDQLSGSDDPADPPPAKLIGGPGSTDGDPAGTAGDGKITVRNVNLSPINGPNTDPGAAGIVAAETQVLTLFAGDGTSYSMKNIMVYTDNEGNDRLSPPPGVSVYSQTFTGTVGLFGYTNVGGTITSSYDSQSGALCITTVAAGDNIAVWTGPYGMLPLVQNAVYRVRAGINTSQSSAALVPFWDLIVNNYGWKDPSDPTKRNFATDLGGLNLYGANFMFLSNTGNANAAVSGQTTDFTLWWCPSPVSTAQWNDTTDTGQPGPWAPSNAANKDAFIEFRVLDAASNTGTNSLNALGTMCLTSLDIDRFDLASIQVVNHVTLPTDTQLTQAGLDGTSSGGGNTRVSTYSTFTASFSGGAVTVTPTGSPALAEVQPGDFDFNLATASTVIDNYPVAMAPNKLYRVTMDLSAPTTNDANAPMDLFWLGADTPTNELICLSYVTLNAWHHGMPKTGTPQTYTAFFFSHNATASSNPAHYSQFRWRWMGGSNAGLGGGGEPNTGAIRLHNAKVDEVMFP